MTYFIFLVLEQHLPLDQRSLSYIRQLETKVKELEEEKNVLSTKIKEGKNDQKINNWNADDGSFSLTYFFVFSL